MRREGQRDYERCGRDFISKFFKTRSILEHRCAKGGFYFILPTAWIFYKGRVYFCTTAVLPLQIIKQSKPHTKEATCIQKPPSFAQLWTIFRWDTLPFRNLYLETQTVTTALPKGRLKQESLGIPRDWTTGHQQINSIGSVSRNLLFFAIYSANIY